MCTRKFMTILALVFGLVLCCQCWSASPLIGQGDIRQLASQIASGVGIVKEVVPGTSQRPLFVFEEFHTSRVGQLQIAVMLLRLHERAGMTTIGLEGAIQSARPLDASWFHGAGGSGARWAREDVAVRMLAEGNISAAEFMTLLYPNVKVYGTETPQEYSVNAATNSPEIGYLLAIAQKSLSPSGARRVNALLSQKKDRQAMEYLLNSDPWVRQNYQILGNPSTTSVESVLGQLREIQTKADAVGADIDPKDHQGLQQDIHFFEVAAERSKTMVNSTLSLMGPSQGGPLAMQIGAAHVQGVTQLLRQRHVSFVLLQPIALNPKYGNLSGKQFDEKTAKLWVDIAPGMLGGLLNGHHKPPPIIETATARSYANLCLAGLLVAQAARGGKRIPDDIWAEINSLPDLRVDRSSFSQDGFDVIFKAQLKKTDGSEATVWTRVGSTGTIPKANSLEKKLLQAIADLGGGGGRIPPQSPPPNSQAAKDEGPGDGERGKVVVSRIGMRELAVFAASKDQAVRFGKLSG